MREPSLIDEETGWPRCETCWCYHPPDQRQPCPYADEVAQTSDVAGRTPTFIKVKVTKLPNGDFKFGMLDTRYEDSIWVFWLSSVKRDTGGTSIEHIAQYLKTTPEVVAAEIQPLIDSAR
jgi:hypothetical protein